MPEVKLEAKDNREGKSCTLLPQWIPVGTCVWLSSCKASRQGQPGRSAVVNSSSHRSSQWRSERGMPAGEVTNTELFSDLEDSSKVCLLWCLSKIHNKVNKCTQILLVRVQSSSTFLEENVEWPIRNPFVLAISLRNCRQGYKPYFQCWSLYSKFGYKLKHLPTLLFLNKSIVCPWSAILHILWNDMLDLFYWHRIYKEIVLGKQRKRQKWVESSWYKFKHE
jgi:hypothetical protein